MEDDDDLGDLLQELFGQLGWIVRIERNGADALRFLQGSLPDLILSDGMMPEMGGREFLEKLRAEERLRSVPVILMSGSDSVLKWDSGTCPWQATIRKPFDPDALVNLVLSLTRPAEPELLFLSRGDPEF